MAEQPFRDAEAWLAERGVRRERLHVRTEPEQPEPAQPEPAQPEPAQPEPAQPESAPTGLLEPPERDDPSAPDDASEAPEPPEPPADRASTPPVTAREATRLATASAEETLRRADESASAGAGEPRLDDDVADAVAFVRRSTANTPQSEARVAGKLRERGWPPAVVEPALARCRAIGVVDDAAMAAALVAEGRRKGHAPRRLRADLRRRDLPDDVVEAALAGARAEDPEAAAFAVAREKADRLTGLDAETAFRRVVGHLARRGHPEALARKVARAAVFDARDPERTAGH